MVTVASAQPHAGPGGRIISLSTRSWGLAAVYRMYPRVERVDLSPIPLSLSRIPPRIYMCGHDEHFSFPPSRRCISTTADSTDSTPGPIQGNDNCQPSPLFPWRKAKADYAAIIAPLSSSFSVSFLSFATNRSTYSSPFFRIRIRLRKIVNFDFWRGIMEWKEFLIKWIFYRLVYIFVPLLSN